MIDGIRHEHSTLADSFHRRAWGDCRLQDLVRLDHFHPNFLQPHDQKQINTDAWNFTKLSCFYIPQFYVSLCTFNTRSTLSCSFLTCFLYPSLLPINPLGHGNNVRAVIRRERERERDWKREIVLIKTKRSTRGNKKYTMRPIKGDLVFICTSCSCVWWEKNRRDGGVNKIEKQEGVRQRPRQSERRRGKKKATGDK